MADSFKPVQAQDFKLAGSGISITDTTIILQSFAQIDGTLLTMSNLGTTGYGCLEPGTVREESITFTGVTQNANGTASLTGVTRGVGFVYPYSQDLTLRQGHAGGTIFRLSNTSAFYSEFAGKNNDEIIAGKWTFPAGGNANAPVSGASYTAPTDDLEYAAKKYVDDIAIAGAPDATTGVKGIVEIATQGEVDAGTNTGGTGASVVVRPGELRSLLQDAVQDGSYVYAADSVGTDSYAITLVPAITAYVTGQVFHFKAGTANTGTSTLNVNGLGAKTLKYANDRDTVTGDIEVGSIVTVAYDGTNFQILSISAGTIVTDLAGQLNTGYSANVTGTNLATLTAGVTSNASSLHTHTSGSVVDNAINTQTDNTYYTYTTRYVDGWSQSGASVTSSGGYWFSNPSGAPGYAYHSPSGHGADTTMQFDAGKGIRVKFRAKLAGAGTDGFGLVVTSTDLLSGQTSTAASIRFYDGGSGILYSVTANGSSNTNNSIAGITMTDWNTYEIIWDGADSALFYVNGVLKQTHTTNLPKTSASSILVGHALADGKDGYFSPFHITIQM